MHTMTATLSGTSMSSMYSIIPPSHDFTQYNRDRSTSGVEVGITIAQRNLFQADDGV